MILLSPKTSPLIPLLGGEGKMGFASISLNLKFPLFFSREGGGDEFVDSTFRKILHLNQIFIINTNSPLFFIILS